MSDPTAITRVAATVALVLFALLIVFQLALALGAPWGRAAYGGQNTGVLPMQFRVASAVAVVVWAAIALVVARRAGLPVWSPLPVAWLPVVVWIVVGLLVVAVVMNAITPSGLERAIWLPFTLLLLASTLTVAITAR
ncbi:hypothetical protein [Pseudolysinimonas yzui]|uniref:Uncharacterized protein n=1 Tax=Pseudolysinimonas yzui TaxID=2708254 RepID=A0A8J3GS91_9MICO|nr:hypothetical protein [Pseudolysinimonas yzui]GHF22142.1 hypothetical protein GCM10011600_24080 [Pseudolysinimonas yzui]